MDTGIVLVGEAAKAYVQFKYIELLTGVTVIILVFLGAAILLWKLTKG